MRERQENRVACAIGSNGNAASCAHSKKLAGKARVAWRVPSLLETRDFRFARFGRRRSHRLERRGIDSGLIVNLRHQIPDGQRRQQKENQRTSHAPALESGRPFLSALRTIFEIRWVLGLTSFAPDEHGSYYNLRRGQVQAPRFSPQHSDRHSIAANRAHDPRRDVARGHGTDQGCMSTHAETPVMHSEKRRLSLRRGPLLRLGDLHVVELRHAGGVRVGHGAFAAVVALGRAGERQPGAGRQIRALLHRVAAPAAGSPRVTR